MSKNLLLGYLALGLGNVSLLMSSLFDTTRFGVSREFGSGFFVGAACVLLAGGLVLFLKSMRRRS